VSDRLLASSLGSATTPVTYVYALTLDARRDVVVALTSPDATLVVYAGCGGAELGRFTATPTVRADVVLRGLPAGTYAITVTGYEGTPFTPQTLGI
jgi:hypothetical protein